MKNIVTAAQTRDADRHTIETEPILSVDLMERAANAFVTRFMQLYPDRNTSILVCCGTGNNGGDGLAVARLLQENGYDAISVWIARFSDRQSDDFTINLNRLSRTPIPVTHCYPEEAWPPINQSVVIDALLGSGLNKPLTGAWLKLIHHIHAARPRVVAVDIPTGLPADGIPDNGEALHADEVITFQRPKRSFFFPESGALLDRFHVVDIGLDESFIEQLPSEFCLIEAADAIRLLRPRPQFSHKGSYGHALVIAGDTHTMGAALLCSGASLYSGAGLTTACIPASGLTALNSRYPEVMYCPDDRLDVIWEKIDAVAIGPGLGDRSALFRSCLRLPDKPLVLDADALTLLAQHRELAECIPPNTILTPHMKEFDRLFGQHSSWWVRVQTARQQAQQRQWIIILKNRYTFITLPDGRILINPTGNPAMASGGMGDVLTGILAAFLAQGYPPEDASVLACYLHGAAGDQMAAMGWAVIPATQLITQLPSTLSAVATGTLLHPER